MLFFPIELLFISSCFPSAAKQAGRGVAFPLGKETDNEVTQKTLVGTVVTVIVGVGWENVTF